MHVVCSGCWVSTTALVKRQTAAALLQIHDPTTKDRQGADVGPQYRSIILYTREQQKETAKQVGAKMSCLANRLVGSRAGRAD